MPQEPHALFKALDTNNDGKLSREELPLPLRAAFDRLDTDGDGFITPAEEAAGREAASGVAIDATPLQSFTAPLSVRGTSVALPIPFDPDDTWGPKERHDVSGTINGHAIRGPLQKDRDGYTLALGPAWLRDTALDRTATVEVALAPEGPQLDDLAEDFRSAMQAEPAASAFFQSISTYYRKNYVRWIEDAKRPETRAKRIVEAIAQLKDHQRR